MGYLLFTVFAVAAVAVAIMMDLVQVPLPHPAASHFIEDIAEDYYPMQGCPLEGVYAPNTALQSARKHLVGLAKGVETVVARADGRSLLLPDKFGDVWQAKMSEDDAGNLDIQLDEEEPLFAHVGPGRPLGSQEDANGDLIICDSKGLIKVNSKTKQVEILARKSDDGTPFLYANDLDIAQDSTVYFSDATTIPVMLGKDGWFDSYYSCFLTLCHGKPSGRLLSYNPESRETKVLLSDMWLPNGVALSHDESFVLVVETYGVRVLKLYLTGPKSGMKEVLIDNLPGLPDGLSRGSDGNFWLSIIGKISPLAKFGHGKAARALLAYLPSSLRPKLGKWGMILKINSKGEILQTLMDPDGGFISSVSSALEHNGHLILGNLEDDYISAFDLSLLKPQ